MSLDITVHCDAGNNEGTCARRIAVATTDPAKALDTARRNGWFIGARQYCPDHRNSGGRL